MNFLTRDPRELHIGVYPYIPKVGGQSITMILGNLAEFPKVMDLCYFSFHLRRFRLLQRPLDMGSSDTELRFDCLPL